MLNFVWMSRRNLGMAALAFIVLLSFTGCGRKFSVSVNEQMLYDPRPSSALVVVADAGLQSCINVLVRSTDHGSLSNSGISLPDAGDKITDGYRPTY